MCGHARGRRRRQQRIACRLRPVACVATHGNAEDCMHACRGWSGGTDVVYIKLLIVSRDECKAKLDNCIVSHCDKPGHMVVCTESGTGRNRSAFVTSP